MPSISESPPRFPITKRKGDGNMRHVTSKHLILLAAATTLIGFTYTLYSRFLSPSPRVPPNLLINPLPHSPHSIKKSPLLSAPLSTSGSSILDRDGKEVKWVSINWYGASDELFVPGGLDVKGRREIVKSIREMGFNSIRLPYSDELVVSNPAIPSHLLAANPDLIGLRALEVFHAVVKASTDEGLAVIVNNHITSSTWCCGANPCDSSFSNSHLTIPLLGTPLCRVVQTEESWIENWETVMKPLTENELVVGVDLRNEPRGVWGTMGWDYWAEAAERAGNRLLSLNPNWLVVVEGTSSSNDLSGVRTRPIILSIPDKVVYSAHVYGWSGWGSLSGSFWKRSYESFNETMMENWAYLVEEDIAPVWVGEFGAPKEPNRGDLNYWGNLIRFLGEVGRGGNGDEEGEKEGEGKGEVGVGWAYWAVNPRKPAGNETEGYALLGDDWEEVVWDYRMRDLIPLMR